MQNGLNKFFDSVSPTAEQKQRMLSNILNHSGEEPRMKKVSKGMSMTVIFAAVILLFGGTALAAALGSFDWLIRRFDPVFGNLAVKVEAVSVDQDIRMEVIGARRYDNMAVIYLSLQDLSGENRITEDTGFRDGFSVKMDIPDGENSGMGMRRNMLYFDEETNTVYYEITIDSDWPIADPLELESFLIHFGTALYENEPIDIDLSSVTEAEAVPLGDSYIYGRDSSFDGVPKPAEILAPGFYAEMPHGNERQWISNVGLLDGYLHVQVNSLYGEFGPGSSPDIYLLSPEGERVDGYYVQMFADGEGRIFLNGERVSDDNIVYRYMDFVYPVDTAVLDNYSLYYSGSVTSGAVGSWKVSANTGDTGKQMRIWANTVPVEGILLEHLTLSPLGLSARGSYAGENDTGLEVVLLTPAGEINLGTHDGSWDNNKKTVNYNWNSKSPVDVSAVTGMKVNGVRIEMN